MIFLYPYVLFGLFAISIPILIHLFNLRRYKKIYFTNVQLLKQLKKETKKQSQLKHLLVLFSRILATSFLVMAFANPMIPVKNSSNKALNKNLVSVYIDNSFSMQSQGTEGELFSKAKSDALEIVNSFSNSDKFNLITNDFDANSNRTFSKEEISDMIMSLDYSPAFKRFSQTIDKQKNLAAKNTGFNNLLFYISDFQENSFDFNTNTPDTSQSIFLVPQYAQQTTNIFIDSCYFESPVIQSRQPLDLVVRIKNVSEKDYEKLPLKLIVNGVQRGLSNFDIKANDLEEVRIKFQVESPGIKDCVLKISDYPVVYDDELFFSFLVPEMYNILEIYHSQPNKYLDLLFSNDSIFSLSKSKYTSINYSSFSLYDLIILDQIKTISSGLKNAIEVFTKKGGSVVIFPPENISQEYLGTLSELIDVNISNTDTIKTNISGLNLDHLLFSDIFDEVPDLSGNQKINFPFAKRYYPMRIPQKSKIEEILILQNDNPFLVVSENNKGRVFLFASPLLDEWTNLHKHALFVPLLYRMALTTQRIGRLYYTISDDELISMPLRINKESEFIRIRLNDEYEFIPESIMSDNLLSINVHDNIKKPGNYSLWNGDNRFGSVSYNYNRNESELKTYPEDILKEIISADSTNIFLLQDSNKPVSQSIKELNEGTSLWKLFLILALVFLLTEIIILRIWK